MFGTSKLYFNLNFNLKLRSLATLVNAETMEARVSESLGSLEASLAAIESELPPVLSSLPRAASLVPLDSARLHRSLVASGLLLLTAFLRLSGAHTEKHAMLVDEMDRLKVLSTRLRTVVAISQVEAEGGGGGGGGGCGEREPSLSLDGAPARRVDAGAAGRFVQRALNDPICGASAAGAAATTALALGKRPRAPP